MVEFAWTFLFLVFSASPGLARHGIMKRQVCQNSGEVFHAGHGCVNMFTNDICQTGERLFLDQENVAFCDCTEDYIRIGQSCFQEKTQGPCNSQEILTEESGVAQCEANPCGNSAASLPREDLSDDCYWDDNCQPHVCLPIKPGDAGRDCFLVRSGNRLGCPGSGAVSSTSVASRSCPLRRTWSLHRQRCVRVHRTRNNE